MTTLMLSKGGRNFEFMFWLQVHDLAVMILWWAFSQNCLTIEVRLYTNMIRFRFKSVRFESGKRWRRAHAFKNCTFFSSSFLFMQVVIGRLICRVCYKWMLFVLQIYTLQFIMNSERLLKFNVKSSWPWVYKCLRMTKSRQIIF